VGIGFERYAELRELAGRMTGAMPRTWPRATSVLTLAQDWLQRHRGLPAEQAQPVYLRDNVAAPTAAQ
jgi:tRNA threonylcarbamoyladenosine biosynthesis protein TsaB